MLFSILMVVSVFAFSNLEVEGANITEGNSDETLYQSSDVVELEYSTEGEMLEATSSNRVRVFFRGVPVAWLVDGAIEYTTGHSPSMWVSEGIGHVHEALKTFPTHNNDVIVYPNTGNMARCDYSTGNCAIPAMLLSDDLQ